jgi:hypothetical protein
VEKMDVALTLPAHRSLVPDAKKRVHELYAHHERRLDEVRELLKKGPRQAYDVAARMTWDMRGQWEDFPVPQKWFACGEALSHLDRLVVLGEAEETARDGKAVFALKRRAPHGLAKRRGRDGAERGEMEGEGARP